MSPKLWQTALVNVLTVALTSIVDRPELFHADLHSGNMIMVRGDSETFDRVALVKYGCCGQLPIAYVAA